MAKWPVLKAYLDRVAAPPGGGCIPEGGRLGLTAAGLGIERRWTSSGGAFSLRAARRRPVSWSRVRSGRICWAGRLPCWMVGWAASWNGWVRPFASRNGPPRADEAPDFVRRAHAGFIEAGAESPPTLCAGSLPYRRSALRRRWPAPGRSRRAHGAPGADAAGRKICVAGGLPPLRLVPARPLRCPPRPRLLDDVLIGGLSPHIDHWLAETQGSIAEAKAVGRALAGDAKPLWLSFTLEDEDRAEPKLRSGEPVARAAAAAEFGAAALLFNCSQPEVMRPALEIARTTLARLGVSAPNRRLCQRLPAPDQGCRGQFPSPYLPAGDRSRRLSAICRSWAEDARPSSAAAAESARSTSRRWLKR